VNQVRLKYVVRINPTDLPETTDPGFEFRYLDIGAVGRGRLIEAPEALTFGQAPSRARRTVLDGDTILATVRTYLRAVWPVRNGGADLVVSTGFAVLRALGDMDPGYLGWVAQSDCVIEEVVARSSGVSYPAINASDVGDVRIPQPSLAQQRWIADYLDRETARIDARIAALQRLVVLLKERYLARVSTLTTQGRARPLRRCLALRTSGPRGWADRVANEGTPFIRSANLCEGDITLNLNELARVRVDDDAAEANRSRTREGDVLVGITGANAGWVGYVASDAAGAFISQHICLLRPSGVHGRWLAYALKAQSAQDQLRAGQYGGTKQQLGLDDLAELVIPVPDMDVQSAVVSALTTEGAAAQETTRLIQSQISLLRERRQALITASVTGELEISEMAA